MVTLTVYVLYSTSAVSVRCGDTHSLCSVLHCCCECTLWWYSLFMFCTPLLLWVYDMVTLFMFCTTLLLWVYDMVTLTVYFLYSTAAVSVQYGDTHCLCSVLHCCCECTVWWHSLFMFCTPLLLWVYDLLTLGVQLWANAVYDMVTLWFCEMVMPAAYFLYSRTAAGGSECMFVFIMCIPVA